MSSAPDLTSRVLRHERLIVAGGILLLVALAWLYVLDGAGMPRGMTMPMTQPPFGAVVLMWWVMMAAMMLPSAAPAILLYARVRATGGRDGEIAETWLFLLGYLALWLLFSLAAAGAQRLVAGPDMAIGSRGIEAAVLIAAGLYQLSPLKSACLGECRAPAQFISRHWRAGVAGAIRLGLLHGAYCVGCCWLLMALLFIGGVMNIVWIVALTLIVAAEKLVPRGEWVARVTGIALIAWGIAQLLA